MSAWPGLTMAGRRLATDAVLVATRSVRRSRHPPLPRGL